MTPRPYDVLLEWASEIGSGRWLQWRAVCRELELEPTGAARALSDLGHVEFDWIEDRFSTVPPTAVLLPRSSGSVLLTGARPRGFRDKVESLAAEGDFDVYPHEPITQDTGPTTWLCEANLEQIGGFCDELGIAYQVQSGRHLAELVPKATVENAALVDRPSDRIPRQWFDVGARRFTNQADSRAEGLWKVQEPRRDAYFYRSSSEWYRVPVREHAPYLAYPNEPFLSYRAAAMTLEVDREAPLPPLLARAVTLQSGRIPVWGRRLRFVNIDADLADLVACRLGTSLTVIAQ